MNVSHTNCPKRESEKNFWERPKKESGKYFWERREYIKYEYFGGLSLAPPQQNNIDARGGNIQQSTAMVVFPAGEQNEHREWPPLLAESHDKDMSFMANLFGASPSSASTGRQCWW
ncbi:unnamed protein product [Cuscuta epithymum]|uniref:Uncharacterized protein n=1 Tax=Cuscuta epithymum TaxID=186058 RepID=A0AAV0EB03_9ASTE|nr:unnamed protein product [Cuscuta epithymum]